MANFITRMIVKEADKSLEKGQKKYRAYFIDTALYAKYKEDVDASLIEKGYQDVIVTE